MQAGTRLTRRHFLAGAAATAAATLLAACGGAASPATGGNAPAASTGSGASTAPVASNAKITLNIAVNNSSPAEVNLMQKAIDLYKTTRPNAEISLLGYDSTTYDQKLITDVSGGTLPDIFSVSDVFNKPFFKSGLITDLKPLAASTGFNLDDFDPQFLSLANDQGKIGFLPRAADVVVMYYNKRMFDEGKVAYPTTEWTMQDYMSAAEKLTKKAPDGSITQYGATNNYTTWSIWVPMVVAEGGKILADDGKSAAFDSPEGVRGWNYIFTGVKNGWFAPPSVQSTMGGPNVPFFNSKAAIVFSVRALTPNVRAQLKDDWDVQLVPKGSAARKSGMGTTGYGISGKAKDPAAAWDYMQFLFTKGLQVFMESYLVVPPLKSFYDSPAWRNLPPPPANNDIFVSATQTAMLPPALPFYSTGPFRQSITDGLDAVTLGKLTPEQAVKQMAAQATAALQS
ncbi:MAG TPA: sugar ABC transporter substrate-binding protein [Thermomicrobiales bacterium]|jgi:multiple sugar transport system substrate-binding protein